MRTLFLAWVLAGFSAHPAFAAPAGAEAHRLVKKLTAFGHRYAGAPRRKEAVALLQRLMRERGLSVERQEFSAADPRSGKSWDMVNLLGKFRPEAPCRFLIGSHYDTRHAAEEDPDPALRSRPIPGANDGTSGTAVVLALAGRLASLLPPTVGADVILFDGEEMGYPDTGGYCKGSHHYAGRLSPGLKGKAKFGIILDMVGSPATEFKIEAASARLHPALAEAVWDIGAAKSPAFSRKPMGAIGDDHVPLSQAGIPAILLIGWGYPQWHTTGDSVDRVSRERLGLVQDTLEEFLKTRLKDFMEDCH